VVNDEDEAASLMQETFLQAYQRLDTFRREAKFTTWLYAIGINLARGSLRKSRRLSPLDEAAVERMQPEFNGGMYVDHTETWNPHRLAELSQRRELVHQAIAQLPEDYRVVITLRDIEEIRTEEVAKMLDVSNGAVRVRLHRARQALRKLLDSHINP
jgi:RNA polymerase sigma-70 factor (ECF subfamily)